MDRNKRDGKEVPKEKRTEDYIAGISFLILLPMITGVLKMLADLALVVVYILSAVNHAG